MAAYQSRHKGETIDDSVQKVQDIFYDKSTVIPVEVGGTGQKTIAGIKSMLGLDDEQSGVQPISKGGTGATTAADARTNLGITPGNIGAVKKSGDTMTGSLSVEKPTYPQVILLADTPDTKALLQIEGSSLQITTENSISDASNERMLSFANSKGQADVKNAFRLLDKVDGTWHYYIVLTTANAAYQIQSLLQGGSISVVKSVQRGSVSLSAASTTVTISSVNTDKAVALVSVSGYDRMKNFPDSGGTTYLYASAQVAIELTNATTLTLYNPSSGNISYTAYWQVVEFY